MERVSLIVMMAAAGVAGCSVSPPPVYVVTYPAGLEPPVAVLPPPKPPSPVAALKDALSAPPSSPAATPTPAAANAAAPAADQASAQAIAAASRVAPSKSPATTPGPLIELPKIYLPQ